MYAPRTVARTVEDGRLAAADLTVRSVYVGIIPLTNHTQDVVCRPNWHPGRPLQAQKLANVHHKYPILALTVFYIILYYDELETDKKKQEW